MHLVTNDTRPPRPLWTALAQVMASTPLGLGDRWHLLNKLYRGLVPADQLRCKDELHQCRQAKRGMVEAVVS